MNSEIARLRQSPTAAWAGPLLLFMGIMIASSFFKVETAGAVWWRRHPEQWAYPLQVAACAAWMWFFRQHYRLDPLRRPHALLATALGVLGIALWILPGWLHHRGLVPEIKWLGCTERMEGFDPSLWKENPSAWWAALALRFARMVLIVPLVEEFFWRGFLWRTVADSDHDFQTLPHGLRNARAFWVTAAMIVLAHGAADRVAAFLWALLIGWLYLHTKSVRACILMHAVANLVLGIYVMLTGQWGYW